MNGVWQFLHDFHDEYANVAFRARDNSGEGHITTKDFYDIMVSIKSHLLTDQVKQNLIPAAQASTIQNWHGIGDYLGRDFYQL